MSFYISDISLFLTYFKFSKNKIFYIKLEPVNMLNKIQAIKDLFKNTHETLSRGIKQN